MPKVSLCLLIAWTEIQRPCQVVHRYESTLLQNEVHSPVGRVRIHRSFGKAFEKISIC